MDSSTIILWTGPFPVAGCLVSFYYYSVLYKVLYLTKHSVDPDQMPRFAASDLGLHSLSMSLLWGARHKWVKLSSTSAADDR